MNNVMATGFHARTSVVLVVTGLVISLLAIPFIARAGGGDSADHLPVPPTHGLSDRARSSHAHPPRSNRATRAVSPPRPRAFAPFRSDRHRQSRSSDRHRESSESLAMRINQLAKDLSPRGRGELATVINQLPKNQRFYDATPKDVALLSNGIGKVLDGSGDQRAPIRILNTLAREVCRRDLGKRLWQPQSLALVVNGLSKGTGGDITEALKAVAREIVHRDLGHWPPHHLAMVVCGIRKTEGKEITACMNVLARELAHQDLHRWQIQHLAMVASGIYRAEGEALTMALMALAQTVIDQQPDPDRWLERHLAIVISGLSKGEGEKINRALNVLAHAVIDRKRQLGQWPEQGLAMVVNGLSKGEGEAITRAMNLLADTVSKQKRELNLWTPQHLVMVVNGFSKGSGEEISRALTLLAQAVIHHRRQLNQWLEQDLAVVVNGLSRGEGGQFTKALSALAKAVTDRKHELGQWIEPHLAMVTDGLSKGTGDQITRALGAVAQAVIDRKPELGQWTEQHLAMVVSGLSKGEGEEISKALTVLAQAVTDHKQELGQWTEQQLAMVVNGLSREAGTEITKALTVLAQAVTDRTPELDQWKGQHLAVVVNGLSRGAGEEITKALNALAQAVVAQRQQLGRWTGQHMAMVVNGLSKGEGEESSKTLTVLAQVVTDTKRELREGATKNIPLCSLEPSDYESSFKDPGKFYMAAALSQWTAQNLAMVVSGLSKGAGAEIAVCLQVLAQEIGNRDLGQWTAQNLAMVVNGLSKGAGAEIAVCLQVLAQEIGNRDLGQWTAQELAMVSSGIGKWAGAEIAECLARLAQEIAVRNLGQWPPQSLAMAAEGMGTRPQHPVFNQLITELVKCAAQKPLWLLITLKNLCRLQLSREQVEAALSLLDALYRTGYRPEGQDARNELLWCLTLVHFSDRYVLAGSGLSDQRRDRLEELYHHYFDREESGFESNRVVDLRSYQAEADLEPDLGIKSWHKRFARDYWQGEQRQQSRGTSLPPTVFATRDRESVSQLQMTIYQGIKTTLSSHQVEMEVSINDFPVDIVIDGHICIEVDGPLHYLQPQQSSAYQGRAAKPGHGDSTVSVLPSLPGERRAKDRFIDYMLAQYGYRVFRIPYTYGPESPEFQQIIDQIQTSLTDKE